MSALVWRAASAMLLLSFVMSANGNVLPQLYFQRHAPSQKLSWLAASLLCATIGSIAGVLSSRARSSHGSSALAAVIVGLIAEVAMLRAPAPSAFVALAVVAQFSVNYALNAIDHSAVRASGEHRSRHDRASTAARLLGMLSAPVIVPSLIDRGQALTIGLVAAAVVAVPCAAAVLAAGAAARSATHDDAEQRGEGLSRDDRRILGFSVAVYVSLYLVAANLIYLLRDVARIADAERRGGATLTVVFFGALLGAALRPKLRATHKQPPDVAHLLAPLPWLVIVPAALSSGWAVPFAALATGGLALGATYGVFLAALREYVSRGASQRAPLLSAFNNLANTSSLVAFALLALAAALSGGRTARAYPYVMATAAMLPIAALSLLTRLRPPRV